MNLKEIFASRNKDYVYSNYQRIFDDGIEYEKITRSKMCAKIADYYSDPENIVALCSRAEVEYLLEILGKEKNIESIRERFDEVSDHKNWLIKEKLDKKMLCDCFSEDIADELVESIKQAALLYKDKKYKSQDDDLCLLLGAMRVYLCMLKESFIKYMTIIFNNDEQTVLNLMDSPRFKYYVETYINENDLEALYYIDIEVDVVDEELFEAREMYGVIIPTFLQPQAYRDIFDYGFDLSKSYNRKYLNQKAKQIDFSVENRGVLETAILNKDIESFILARNYIKNMMKESYDKNDEKLVHEVVENYPSAVLLGNTIKAFRELTNKVNERNKKHMSSFKKQTNACIGDGEANQFYSVYFSLLSYLNKKYQIKPELQKYLEMGLGIKPEEVVGVSNFFFKDPTRYVDEYLYDEGLMIPVKYKRILEDFKKAKSGTFILYEYSEQYSKLIGEDAVYLIKGVRCNLDEIVNKDELPTMINANLLMYKGNIIYDGVFSRMPVKIVNNALLSMDKAFNDLPKKYSLNAFDSSIKKEESAFEAYIVGKGKTDMLSSLFRLKKETLEQLMEEYACDDIEELKYELVSDFEMLFDSTCDDDLTKQFFNTLLKNENSDNLVFTSSDYEACIVFVYEENGKIKYYIPDEIRKIIKNKLNNYS